MADRDVDVLIVGTGPAGSACAAGLRSAGFSGSVMLLGREPDPPYDRPPSSKEYLAGTKDRAALALHDDGFWAEQEIELVTRAMAMSLDPEAKTVKLADKREIGYGQLVLATGANVRRLRVEGAALAGIHYLRAPGNADSLRADLDGRTEVVLIGGSFIACEVAATLTALGKHCTLVAMEEQPLADGVGPTVGGWVAERLREQGIDLRMGEMLAGFEGDGERVTAVVTESGARIPAEVVVMGTGAVPEVALARKAGLEPGESGGIVTDAYLRTALPDVWAAGDVCEYDSVVHGRRLRVEHWEHAIAQGKYVADAIAAGAAAEPFATVPYFWSDLGDWLSYEAVGPAAEWDSEVVRGSLEEGRFTVFYLRNGVVVQALTVGRSSDLDAAAELISSGVSADQAALAAT